MKMRTQLGTILIAVVALAVGAAAGWSAAGAWGERKCGNVELWNCGNVETANVGRARSPSAPSAPKVTDAELAALRGKVATLEKELKEIATGRAQYRRYLLLPEMSVPFLVHEAIVAGKRGNARNQCETEPRGEGERN